MRRYNSLFGVLAIVFKVSSGLRVLNKADVVTLFPCTWSRHLLLALSCAIAIHAAFRCVCLNPVSNTRGRNGVCGDNDDFPL